MRRPSVREGDVPSETSCMMLTKTMGMHRSTWGHFSRPRRMKQSAAISNTLDACVEPGGDYKHGTRGDYDLGEEH